MDETYARILTTKTQEAKNGAILSLWYTDPNTGEERYRIAWDYRVPIARLYDGQNKLGEYSYPRFAVAAINKTFFAPMANISDKEWCAMNKDLIATKGTAFDNKYVVHLPTVLKNADKLEPRNEYANKLIELAGEMDYLGREMKQFTFAGNSVSYEDVILQKLPWNTAIEEERAEIKRVATGMKAISDRQLEILDYILDKYDVYIPGGISQDEANIAKKQNAITRQTPLDLRSPKDAANKEVNRQLKPEKLFPTIGNYLDDIENRFGKYARYAVYGVAGVATIYVFKALNTIFKRK